MIQEIGHDRRKSEDGKFTPLCDFGQKLSECQEQSFIAALKRFVSRRRNPTEVHSDCGTNFIAADKELKRVINSLKENELVNKYCSTEGIKWIFNPPAAPHFGGLWEAAVKSTKLHLKRTIGEQLLTQEEFTTLLAQIEACLNSRPLCPLSEDPSEFSALTPGHFLIGIPLTALPEESLHDQKIPILQRWKLVEKMFQSFWKRWSYEYISNLQRRSKWLKVQPNLKVNDLVIIKEDNLPPRYDGN
ncbi:uncharacterized protein LOC118202587 [Stegodyphus dumicola]|uniref:uncharacterized protein LOC118202587 n=1 Tax=Stegodyphus dumicola TaxID=202533 RepID=UPI0015AC6BD1|nr:uncharacterized protein LOC118202587 [Stegodyphus dumicola]